MNEFRIDPLTISTSEGKAKELLENAKKNVGKELNVFGVLAHSPELLEAYFTLGQIAGKGNFSAKYREQLAIAIAQENQCEYCLSAHTTIGKGAGLSEEEMTLNRKGDSLDSKTAAGLKFAQEVVKTKGLPSKEEIEKFKSAGYTNGDVMETILVVVINTLTNYANHIAKTEVDFPKVSL
ncbi:hypothetical protein UJ101_00591 [Flavobacteriaceae bacterium UJ101]|nr:hypothetical protein UJ101_00591 [Flavobacteriaceae bacterium UJ101]